MNLIPRVDLPLYASLPLASKEELRVWLQFARESDSGHGGRHASGRNGALVASYAARLGCSAAHVRRKLTQWRQLRDWKVFVNKARAGASWWRGERESVALRKEFIAHLQKIFCANQRKCKPAWRALIRQWRSWANGDPASAVPGYDHCPPPGPGGIPHGWSYANLIRYRPSDYALTAARIGRAAASDLRLQVFTSRDGLRVGEYIQLDDHEFNFKVNFAGQTRAMRPRMLGALDVFSACDFCQGFKPTLWDEAAEKKRVLREIDTMWLVVAILTKYGYRTDERGTTLVVEWGTAAIRSDFEERIREATSGHVFIERSGKFGKASFTGLFEGAVKGNYRFKASRESLFNLLDNELAALPAQVGKDRDHSPEELYGLERYNERLLKASALLPADRAAQLLFPVLEWNQAIGLLLDAFHNINTRTDHDLEGWERAGLTTSEWSLPVHHSTIQPFNDSTWLPAHLLADLPDDKQLIIRSILDAHPELTRVRKLSPMEVWQRGQSELTPLPRLFYPDLVGLDYGRELKVQNGLFEFQDRELSPDPLRYRAVGRSEVGRVTPCAPLHDSTIQPFHGSTAHPLTEGETYLCFVNPFDPQVLIACDARGGYLAECPLWDAPCRNDHDAIKKKLGEAKQWEAEQLRQLGIAFTDRAATRAAMHGHNAQILGHSPVTSSPKINTDNITHDDFVNLPGPEPRGTRAEAPRAEAQESNSSIAASQLAALDQL